MLCRVYLPQWLGTDLRLAYYLDRRGAADDRASLPPRMLPGRFVAIATTLYLLDIIREILHQQIERR